MKTQRRTRSRNSVKLTQSKFPQFLLGLEWEAFPFTWCRWFLCTCCSCVGTSTVRENCTLGCVASVAINGVAIVVAINVFGFKC